MVNLEEQIEAIIKGRINGFITQELDQIKYMYNIDSFKKAVDSYLRDCIHIIGEETHEMRKLARRVDDDIFLMNLAMKDKKVRKAINKLLEKLGKIPKTESADHSDSETAEEDRAHPE